MIPSEQFIPGLELNRKFFNEAVIPLLNEYFPDLKYSAAFLGYGSDVLGVDTPVSMDHNWGPRGQIFINENQRDLIPEINRCLMDNLPPDFQGFPVNFTDPRYDCTQTMEPVETPPVRHLIQIMILDDFFKEQLSLSAFTDISNSKWLSFQDQILLELTGGEVFYDGLNRLNSLRKQLHFFPLDVLKLRLACLWLSVWNEEPFIGRCIDNGDFIGVKTITSRLVVTLMKIAFYLENRYIPYSKWFGTLFKTLGSAKDLLPLVTDVLQENDSHLIQEKICLLSSRIVELHNSRSDLPHLDNTVRNFFNRPYKVIFAESIVETLVESVEDPSLKNTDLKKIAWDIKIDSVDFT